MNKRKRKKLKNRAGFFHYKSYKWRVRALYDMMKPIMTCSMPYSFKLMMFEYAKDMLFVIHPKKIYTRNHRVYDYNGWVKALREADKSQFRGDLDHPVSSDITPSMSVRMFGDKIHSFSIDEGSFKNGYKPGELAQRVQVPRFTNPHKSMPSFDISPMVSFMGDVTIDDEDAVKSVDVTIEHGDTDRMRRKIMADEYIKGVEETPSEPIHLGPIDLGPTDGERIEEHLDDLIDQRKRFAGNSCEASAMD